MNKKADSRLKLITGGVGLIVALISGYAMSQKFSSGNADAIIPSIIGLIIGIIILGVAAKMP